MKVKLVLKLLCMTHGQKRELLKNKMKLELEEQGKNRRKRKIMCFLPIITKSISNLENFYHITEMDRSQLTLGKVCKETLKA